MLHGPSLTPGNEYVVFEWSTKQGHCYECGLPAAFYIHSPSSPPAVIRDDMKRCSVCAANAAADGEYIARIEPLD